MSRERLEEHRRLWDAKPVLRSVYAVWFEALIEALPRGGAVLEVGAGPGCLAQYARQRVPGIRWMASELLDVPWADLVADGLRLPVRSAAVRALVGVDVVHHLADPARFFEEAGRVMEPGGRLLVLEPWVSPFSHPIYRWLHQEGCHPKLDPWRPFGSGTGKDAFEGDAAVVSRLMESATREDWRRFGLASPSITILNGFAYLASLGFREGSLVPPGGAQLLMALDRKLAWASKLLGLRALCVWDRLPNER